MKRMLRLGFFLSVAIFWPALPMAGVVGDINNDGKIDLQEAIYALQVASGVYPSLDPSLVLVGKGSWGVGGTYIAGDVIDYNGLNYVCVSDHTSEAGVNEPPDDTFWTLLTIKGEKGDPGEGVPPGFLILGTTSNAPTGFTYHGAIEGGGGWFTRAVMTTGRRSFASAVVGNKIYTFGGNSTGANYVANNEEYDPETNAWTTRAQMPTGRAYFCAAAVDGKIYAIGGYNGSYLDVNEMYDPQTDTWAAKAPMPTPRGGHAAAVFEGKIYVVGGANGSDLSVNEMYDPVYDTWTAKADMPGARAYAEAAAVGGRIYVIGGHSSTVPLSTNEEYDPVENSWSAKTGMPTSRKFFGIVVSDTRIYAVGGDDGTGTFLPAYEVYDAVTNTWSILPDMGDGRRYHEAAAVAGAMYVIGGQTSSFDYDKNDKYTLPWRYHLHQKD